MKKRNKIFSMLITLIMIFQSFAYVQALADETVQSPEICKLADFGTFEGIKESGIRNGKTVTASVEQSYGDAYTSLKIGVQKLTTNVVKTDGINWGEYAYFRMRIYANQTGDVINIISATNPIAELTHNPYMRHTYTVNQTGWQDVTLKLSDFGKNSKPLATGEESHSPAWNEMKALYLAIGEWNTAYTEGNTLYIDEIWLEKDTVSYNTEASQINEADKVIANFNSLASVYSAGMKPQTANTRINGNEVYGTWDIPALKLSSLYLYNNSAAPLDLSAYKWMNLWVYSPKAQDGGILAVFKEGNSLKVHNLSKAIDWKGWKFFSVNIGEYKSVSQIYLCANGWPNNDAVPGSATARWFNAGLIGVEKVWLSASAATAPEVTQAPSQSENTEFAPDAYIANEFSSTANMVDKGGVALKNIAASVDNNNNYDMTARFQWDVANADKVQKEGYLFKAVGSTNQTSDDIKNTKISPELIAENDYNFANFLVYNPGKKLKDSQTSKLNFIVLYGTAADNSTFSGGYGVNPVEMDWSGWKVVSIPLLAKADTCGIYSLSVNAGGWTSSVNGWADIGNYIDVDSVWLSKEAYANNEFVSSTVVNGAVNVPSSLDGNNTITYTFTNYIASDSEDEVSVYADYVPVDPELYTVTVNGKDVSVVFDDSLTETSLYTVKFSEKFADAYGVNSGKAFSKSFTVEDFHMNSDVLIIENDTVNGFKNMTLADVRKSVTYSTGADLKFIKGTTEITDETAPAESGMYAVVSKNGKSKKLKLGFEFVSVDNFRYFVNGAETDGIFEVGTLKITADARCYRKDALTPVTLIIAQYEGDELINICFEPYNVGERKEISAEIELKKVSGTTLSVFVWDSLNSACPVNKPINHNI